MSDNIEVSGDLAAFVSSRELPWHHLGTTVDGDLDVTSALEIAHLTGWDVRKTPLFTTVPLAYDDNGVMTEFTNVEIEGKFAIVRNNPFIPGQIDALGVGGKVYHPVQNEEHGEFLNALVDGGAKIETAGSLKGGREVFITMKAPEHMLIGGKDRVDLYVSALNTHDGSKAFRVITTPVRIVCSNTQAAALGNYERMFSKRHTAGNGGAVQRAREVLDMTFSYTEAFSAEAEKMVQQTLTNNQFFSIIEGLYPVNELESELVVARQKERQDDLMTLFKESPTIADIRGTNWAGYQAITEYLDHFVTIPGKEGKAEAAARAEKVFAGEYDARKVAAFKAFAIA